MMTQESFRFEVIDASKLADWIGLVNGLPPICQILEPKASSAIFTETLRLTAKNPHEELADSLFMGVDLASIILGVVPTGHVSLVRTSC